MAFTNRVVEFPGRVTLTDVSTGTVLGTFDVTRAEGQVTSEGTALTAENLNSNIADAVQAGVDTITDAISIDANQNVGFRNLQSGNATVKITTAKTTMSVQVTFKEAFTKVPTVVCTPYATSPVGTIFSVANITTTGFTIYCYRTTVANVGFRWIAFTK